MSLNFVVVECSRCPAPYIVDPCICSGSSHSLICIKNNSKQFNSTISLAQVFDKISKSATKPEDRSFEEVIIANTQSVEFNESLFSDITFKKLFVLDNTLTKIDSKVFLKTYSTVEEVYMNLYSLKVNQQNYNLFDALSSLVNLETLNLDFGINSITLLPDNAFKASKGVQKDLKEINIYGQIGIVGQHAFAQLPNLRRLRISDKIHSIGTHSFEYKSSSKDELNIDLSFNKLEANCFEPNSLSNIRRPVNLILNQNNLKYLDKPVFHSFLEANKYNKLNLMGNPLNCSDCRSFWMTRLKSKLKHRVYDPICTNGKTVWDFKWNCKKNSSYLSIKLSFVLSVFVLFKVIII